MKHTLTFIFIFILNLCLLGQTENNIIIVQFKKNKLFNEFTKFTKSTCPEEYQVFITNVKNSYELIWEEREDKTKIERKLFFKLKNHEEYSKIENRLNFFDVELQCPPKKKNTAKLFKHGQDFYFIRTFTGYDSTFSNNKNSVGKEVSSLKTSTSPLEKLRNLSEEAKVLLNNSSISPNQFNKEYISVKTKFQNLKDYENIYPHKYKELEALINKLSSRNHAFTAKKNNETLKKSNKEKIKGSVLKESNNTDSKDKTVENLKEHNKILEQEKKVLIQEQNSLKSRVNDLNQEINRLSSTNSSLSIQVEELEIENVKLETQTKSLRDRVLKSEGANLGGAIGGLLKFGIEIPKELFSKLSYNGTIFEFVRINKGEFAFGITDEDYKTIIENGGGYRHDNEIVNPRNHSGYINTDYLIGKYEVTNKQYAAVIKEHSFKPDSANLPVVNLTYSEMLNYCLKLGNALGFSSGAIISLPTEKQWEYAARGSDGRYFPWGNNLNIKNGTYANTYGRQIFEVGRYEEGKSWCGAYDMIGNVYEACFIDDISYQKKNSGEKITVRGGSFKTKLIDSRTTTRYTLFGEKRRNDVGFRLIIKAK